MEPIDVATTEAAEAAITAYRAARRSRASRRVADDVALARFRAYFPLATKDDCRGSMREHLPSWRLSQRREIRRPAFTAALVVLT
jgi:hypothetical protein